MSRSTQSCAVCGAPPREQTSACGHVDVSSTGFGDVFYGGAKPLSEFEIGDIVLGAAPDGWVFLRVLTIQRTYHPETAEVTWVQLNTDTKGPVSGPPGCEAMYGREQRCEMPVPTTEPPFPDATGH